MWHSIVRWKYNYTHLGVVVCVGVFACNSTLLCKSTPAVWPTN